MSDDQPRPELQRPSLRLDVPDAQIRSVDVEWDGELRFRGTAAGRAAGAPSILIDANVTAGPGPMHSLLVAAAACGGADVVGMLDKMQVKLRRYRTRVEGIRAPDHPKRYTAIHFRFELAGDGLDELKARRAIDLSISKYCSVLHSLREDIPITYEIVIGD